MNVDAETHYNSITEINGITYFGGDEYDFRAENAKTLNARFKSIFQPLSAQRPGLENAVCLDLQSVANQPLIAQQFHLTYEQPIEKSLHSHVRPV